MTRFLKFLHPAALYLVFLPGCQGIRPVGDTEFSDKLREKRFRQNPAKLAVLRRAANERLPEEYQNNAKLLKRYDYWPIVVDNKFRGLWHFDDYSHQGPILVINGAKTATVVPLLLTKAATLDSLNAALLKYSLAEISPSVRTEIVRNISSVQFLH